MYVTTVDFQANMDKYLAILGQEDIFIMENGKTVAKMIRPKESVVASLRGLLKDVPSGITAGTIRAERLGRYERHV